MGESSTLRIAYPPQSSVGLTPIIEIPDTPERPQFYTAEEFEVEKTKLHEWQIEFRNQQEEKWRQGVTYLRDKIQWSTFYDQLTRIVTLMDELNKEKDGLDSLAQKWRQRNNDVTIICMSTVQMPYHQVERIFDLLNQLDNFENKRDSLQRKLILYFSKYLAKKFTLFPCALESVDTVKEKEKWKKEMDELFDNRITNIISETGHWFWEKTNEELVKIQLYYADMRKEFDDLEKNANSLIKIQRETLSFDWPDDDTFDR